MSSPSFPSRARRFLWIVGGSALILPILLEVSRPIPEFTTPAPSQMIAVALAILAVVIGRFFPVCLGDKFRAQVSEIVVFAAILLFHPLTAAFIAAMGCAIYYAIKFIVNRWPPYVLAFNTAQHTLATLLSGLAYHGWKNTVAFSLSTSGDVLRILLAVAIYLGMNWSLTATFSGLFQGRSLLSVWASLWKQTWILEVSEPLLGIVLAVVYLYAPIGAVLLIIPFVALYQSYQSVVLLRRQTRETLELLADTVDRRDPYTYQHSARVAEYARALAERLGLSSDEVEVIELAARVHDLGKIGVPDQLLMKPEALTASERDEIRQHAVIGANIVSKLPQYQRGKEYILYHHERYDGRGIFKLHGKHIPLGARVIAIADAFDAMTSDRPYRQALSFSAALEELEKERGRQFDPAILDAFVAMIREHMEEEAVTGPAASTEPSAVTP